MAPEQPIEAQASIKTVILCGGRGTRAHPISAELPKPLIDVGDRPVLRHVMEIYAGQGFDRFVLAAGFKAGLIREFADGLPSNWEVEVVDTGEDTQTGERVARCRDRLGPLFFLTYGDGLANVDLHDLLSFHDTHAGSATVTIVPLPSPYGTISTDARDRVVSFQEKPVLRDRWINGGFFVMEQRVFERWPGTDLEFDVLPELSDSGELYAYRHVGFWKSLDTYKDALALSALTDESGPQRKEGYPWLHFETRASS